MACVSNGQRILDDAGYLEEYGRMPSARALAILAQEEFAKAYLLRLVDEDVVPYCDEVMRACRDHSCKHLIGLVMLHLFTPDEELIERGKHARESLDAVLLPKHVSDALNIFCHEKLHRWRSKNWFWVDNMEYDRIAKRIGDGSLDRTKQDSLYVGIGNHCVTNIPRCSPEDARSAIQTAKVLKEVANGNDAFAFSEKEHIKAVLKLMLNELGKQTG